MMENYANQINLTTDALNSQGFAEQVNEKRMESFAAKQEQLKADMAGIWNTIVDTDAIKIGMDLLHALLGLLGGVPAKLATIVAVSLLLKSAFAGFKASTMGADLTKTFKSFGQAASGITTLLKETNAGATAMYLFGTKAQAASVNISELKEKQLLAAQSARVLGISLKAIGIGLAIGAVVWGFSALIEAEEKAIETSKELTKNYASSSKEIQDNVSTLEGMRGEFEKLSEGVDENGQNIGLAADQYSRYKDMVKQIVDMNPLLIKGYDAEGNALINNNTLLRDAIDLQKELSEQKLNDYLLGGKDILKGARSEVGNLEYNYTMQSESLRRSLMTGLDSTMGKGVLKEGLESVFEGIAGFDLNHALGINFASLDMSQFDKIVDSRDLIIERIQRENLLSDEETQKLETQLGLLALKRDEIDAVNGRTQTYLSLWSTKDTNESWYNKIDSRFLDDFNNGLSKISQDSSMSIEEMQIATKNLGTEFLAIQNQIPANAFNQLNKQLQTGEISEKEYNKALTEIIETMETLKEKCPLMVDILDSIITGWKDFANVSSEVTPTLSPLSSVLETLSKNYDVLSSAQREVIDDGVLSIDTMKNLIEQYPELESKLVLTANGYTIEAAAIREANDAKLAQYRIEAEKSIEGAQNIVNATGEKIDAYSDEISAIQELILAKQELIKLEMQELVSSGGYVTDPTQYTDLHGQLQSMDKAFEDIVNGRKRLEELEILRNQPVRGQSGGTSHSSNKDLWKEAFDRELKDLQYLRDKCGITEQEYYTQLEKLNLKYFAKRKEYLDDYRKYELEVESGLLKLAQSRLKTEGDAAVSRFDRLIEEKREELKLLDEEYEAEDDLFQLQKAIDKYGDAKNNKNTRVYHADQGWVWEANAKAVADAKEEQERISQSISRKQAKKEIEEEIKVLEEHKQKWQEAIQKIGMSLNDHNASLDASKQFQNASVEEMAAAYENYANRVIEANRRIQRSERDAKSVDKISSGSSSSSKNNSSTSSSSGKPTSSSTKKKMGILPSGQVYYYAKGTKNAAGGLSVVDEEGDGSELPFRRLPGGGYYQLLNEVAVDGRYAMLSQGSEVIPKKELDNLWELSKLNPQRLLENRMKESLMQINMVVAAPPTQPPTMVFNIDTLSLPSVTDPNNFVKSLKQYAQVHKRIR